MLKMIELPYPINALEPYYSTKTLELHYKILYKGYVDNTNKTEEKAHLKQAAAGRHPAVVFSCIQQQKTTDGC